MIKGDSYKCQAGRPWLKPGNWVLVQPGHIAKEPYQCIIQEHVIKWVGKGERLELCTHIPGQHSAVIWEYWVDRLSPIDNFILVD